MTQKYISSREFNQDIAGAKRAAKSDPVIITDRGKPSLVLLSIDEYRRLTGTSGDLAEMLAMPEDDIDFEPGRLSDSFLKPADFD